ncbi:MAG TPA: thioredoxin domain-containing protein [Steroidobacteraceae bacterium]|nr:thioredoxin domain-containing protein [Steroidobacteraceae bacterium]
MTGQPALDLKVPIGPTDHVRGSRDARITVVEYGDFECPICRAAEPGVRMLLDQHPTTVRLIYRHYPVESAHPHALMAAEAAEAAAAEDQFWPMHDLLLRQHARLDRATLNDYATQLNLGLAQFKAALDDEIYRQRVREQVDGATRSHVRTSPGFFVNGRLVDVSGGLHRLGEAIAQQLR